MSRTGIGNDYFEWLLMLVSANRYIQHNSYRKLLAYLHSVEFVCLIRGDTDRAYDGIDLRDRYTIQTDDAEYVADALSGPCSVLEMMVALAIRCEETIMDDPKIGDRTGQWFWKMIVSIGLGSMTDERFDDYYVEEVIDRFLNRKYEPDGRGGLFTIKNCDCDLRDMEIWNQLCYYLDSYVDTMI